MLPLKGTALCEHLVIAVVKMVVGYGLSLFTRNIPFWLAFAVGTIGVVLFTMGTMWQLALAAATTIARPAVATAV